MKIIQQNSKKYLNTKQKKSYLCIPHICTICCIFLLTISSGCSTASQKSINKPSIDLFTGKIQLEGKKISPKKSINLIDVSSDDEEVSSESKDYLYDDELGIEITVLNNTENDLSYQECDIQKITFTKNVSLPGNVTIGMDAGKVCNAKTGIYGEPDNFTGSLLYGTGLDNTYAIYKSEDGNIQVSLGIDSIDNTIKNITYEYTSK